MGIRRTGSTLCGVRRASYAFVLTLVAVGAAAETTGGTLRGRITDESNTPIVGAEITATHVVLGASWMVRSGSDGRYQFPTLSTGGYELTAEKKGYATVTVRKIDVFLATDRRVDVRLKKTDEEEQLTVTAPFRMVESTPAISMIITRDLLSNVPLRDRNALELQPIAPLADPRLVDPGSEVLFNGSESSIGAPLGAIEQMNVMTGQYTAEFGHASGGVVLLVPQLGSNEYDGEVFAFYRNREQRTQYGASAGGPIVADRAHFFAAADGDRDARRRFFATANGDVAANHFVEGDFRSDGRGAGQARDLWFVRESFWNELIAQAGENQLRDSVAGTFSAPRVQHNWRAGGSTASDVKSLFAQDEIVAGKIAFSGGIRYDRIGDQNGLSPRIGWVYDVNGSGRNLLRGGYGRYLNPDAKEASIGYSWQTNAFVALNVDVVRSIPKNAPDRNALAMGGHIRFSPFIMLAGSYTYSQLARGGEYARHVVALAGELHLPGEVWLSGIERYRSSTNGGDTLASTDVRIAKKLAFDHLSFDVMADLLNAFNRPRQPARSEQFGLRVNF